MRFVNFIAALAAIADITSALHDIPSADASAVEPRAHPPKSSPIDIRNSKKALHKRADTDLVAEVDGIHYVYEGGFLDGHSVRRGEYVRVFDVSGCSAIFFFDNAGVASASHIIAGRETEQATQAAYRARAARTTDYVKVFTCDNSKFTDIKAAIIRVLGDHTTVRNQPFAYNRWDRTERWQFTYKSGSTSRTVTAEKYKD